MLNLAMQTAPQAVLQWDRGTLPAECERAAIIREGVETYLGRSVFAPDGQVLVRVSLSRVAEAGTSRIVARVSQQDGSGKSWGERSVSGGADCASLDEQVTLVVALMVDSPAAAAESDEPEAKREPAPPPILSPKTPEESTDPASNEIETAPNLERAMEAPGHAVVLGFGALALGTLPEMGAGGGLAVLLKPRGFWGFGLEAELFAPQQKSTGSGHIKVSLQVARASLCPLQGAQDGVWWSACASLGVGRLKVTGRELLEASRHREWILMPGFGVRAAWVWRQRWLLGGGLAGAFPVSPDHYNYRDTEGVRHEAFTMNQLGLTANLGVGVMLD
jgi:hypothetical protein